MPKIRHPRLLCTLCLKIVSNLRSLLPHLQRHSFDIFRKYSSEGIGVRMAAYKLVLIRHGESCWNQENRFCGWFDADLSETGEQEAKRGGQALKGNATGPNLIGLPLGHWIKTATSLCNSAGWANR